MRDSVRHLGRASETIERTWLANEVLKVAKRLEYGSGREGPLTEGNTANRASTAAAGQSKLDEAIISELRGDWAPAASFYLGLVDDQSDQPLAQTCGGLSQVDALRIAVTAFIIYGDSNSALSGCEKLKRCAKSPEDIFVECLAWELDNSVKSSG